MRQRGWLARDIPAPVLLVEERVHQFGSSVGGEPDEILARRHSGAIVFFKDEREPDIVADDLHRAIDEEPRAGVFPLEIIAVFLQFVPLARKRRQDSTPRAYPPSMQGKTTVIAGAAIVLAGCGGSSQTAVTLTSTLEITKTVTVTAPPPPSVPKTTMETDGTYRVGTDIVPGTYRSAGPSPEGASDCYWARLSSLNETHIIDSNISTGPQVVMIQPSDRAFLTHSCQPWHKAD